MCATFNPVIAKSFAIAAYEQQWKSHPYAKFLARASMKDVGLSQYSFYHAVEAFPRMLALLASKIARNENRRLIVDNLYEEHGAGDATGFHTLSFKKFLTALGMDISELYNDESSLFNPGPSRWNRQVALFLSTHTAAEAAAYLAGIEYLYAGISADIAHAVSSFPLLNEQAHYAVHAELDWEHGAELAEVALALSQCPVQATEEGEVSEDMLVQAYHAGMTEFLALYDDMVLPVEADILPLAGMPISFFFTREDPNFTASAVDALIKAAGHVNAVVIASGGETTAALLTTTRQHGLQDSVSFVDMNPRQLALCHAKENQAANDLYATQYGIQVDTQQYVETEGKFEALFGLLRQYLGKYAQRIAAEPAAWPHCPDQPLRSLRPVSNTFIYRREANAKLRFVLGQLFSNHFLSIVFTEQATAYTSDSFAEHFYRVFMALSMKTKGFGKQNFDNVFFNKAIPFPMPESMKSKDPAAYRDFFDMQSALEAQTDGNYVDMSNIGDWMPTETFQSLLAQAHKVCTHVNGVYDKDKVGFVVVRKLLGDYSLSDLVANAGFPTVIECNCPSSPFHDHAGFYSEVVIGITQPHFCL